jgi:uncharacterized protein YcbX
MLGEVLDEAVIDEGGVLGDRAYALIDRDTGRVASAKLPKKWGGMLEFSARFMTAPRRNSPAPAVRIEWPDGSHVASNVGDPDGKLSETLGRRVTLTTMRPEFVSVERLDPLDPAGGIRDIGDIMLRGKFADYAPIHLLTTATLAQLSALRPDIQFHARRFRPNLVIETAADRPDFVENGWIGKTVAIGDEVCLRISDPTPRCSVPTLAQKGIPKDPRVLRAIVEHNRIPVSLLDNEMLPCAGVYGFIVRGGTVRRGDAIWLE